MYTELTSHMSLANFSDRLNDLTFTDRVYQVLIEDGNDINYGEYIAKYYRNGMTRLLKSLGIYKVTGRADNKQIVVHPRLLLIIETTLLDPQIIGLNVVKLMNGGYDPTPFIGIDFSEYDKLEMSVATKQAGNFSTYIIFNPSNNLYKIGKSKNVFKRFESLKSEFNHDLQFVGFCENDFESELHFEYKLHRVFGEWFRIATDDVLDIFLKYKFIQITGNKGRLKGENNVLSSIKNFR